MIITSKYIFDTETKTTFPGYIQMKGNRIIGKGPLTSLPENEEIIDYGTNMIIPAFIDAHTHFFLSVLLFNQKLTFISGKTENEVAEKVPDLPIVNGWKIGIGWFSSEFGQNVLPTRKSIDEVCSEIPVVLISGDAHTIWMNTKAMTLLHITTDQLPKEVSGEAIADEDGLTGVFFEAIAIHYLALILQPLKKDFQVEFQNYVGHLNKMGITTLGDVALTGEALDDFIYPELYETVQEDSKIRISFYPAMREETETIEKMAENYHSETLTFAGVKQFFDGVTSTHTAFLKEEYETPYFSGDVGLSLLPVEKMKQLIFNANEKGWPIRIHTVGDLAIHLALNYYQESQEQFPLADDMYNTLEHLEVMDAVDVPLVHQKNLVLSVQPSHLLVGWDTLDDEVGSMRASQMFPFRSFLNEGATLGFGTDSPVVVDITPIESIYFAVARKDLAGYPTEGLMPEQRISIPEALFAHTRGAAMALSRSDVGSLDIGTLADICVLDHNILEDTPEELLKTKMIATYFDGELLKD
ncbi:amidohydrolase family protein [Jeotgalibaca sp. MA1X17-3]|uniref:amidohydrolase n=1 Tax=Jeotgalibaca sp. MA1X17-3 TaxID=2908211 RepID=UPI001F1CEBC3|nr:amidohydrolase family protein [Jeotgalibaca sp. MA1X17-3]UJF16623.1 amidohydrolase family protein [Jeotgalibaca sp. MA1X17-3]